MSPTTQLTRSKERFVGGVCGGIAAYLGVDPTLVRLITVALIFFTGFGLLLYLVLWAILPEEGTRETGIQQLFGSANKAKERYQETAHLHNRNDLR